MGACAVQFMQQLQHKWKHGDQSEVDRLSFWKIAPQWSADISHSGSLTTTVTSILSSNDGGIISMVSEALRTEGEYQVRASEHLSPSRLAAS